jgi:hypothetical protein
VSGGGPQIPRFDEGRARGIGHGNDRAQIPGIEERSDGGAELRDKFRNSVNSFLGILGASALFRDKQLPKFGKQLAALPLDGLSHRDKLAHTSHVCRKCWP